MVHQGIHRRHKVSVVRFPAVCQLRFPTPFICLFQEIQELPFLFTGKIQPHDASTHLPFQAADTAHSHLILLVKVNILIISKIISGQGKNIICTLGDPHTILVLAIGSLLFKAEPYLFKNS